MSFTPRPCAHCGGLSFHMLPDIQLEVWHATQFMGMNASTKVTGGVRWCVTAVICTQCGRTETFTRNAAQLAEHIPGAQLIAGAER